MGEKQYIDIEDFVTRMREHWTTNLSNVSSKELELTWRQLAQAFKKNILSHTDTEQRDEWLVVQPPTGSGKTQGTILYSAMLPHKVDTHPGVLIITRLKAEADIVAEQINELAGESTAVAHHSDTNTSFEELREWPVLVITHKAYELALDYLGRDGSIRDTFEFFHSFDHNEEGRRKLAVVDECLDIVENHQIDKDGIELVLEALKKAPGAWRNEKDMLQKLDSHLEQQRIGLEINPQVFKKERMMVDYCQDLDFSSLRGAIWEKDIKWEKKITGKYNVEVRRDIQRRIDNILKALEHMAKQFVYYAHHNGNQTWNTARLLVPEDVKGAVVLDATAGINTIYELFDKAVVWSAPENVRNYQNVKLHVSTGHKVGKESMSKNPQSICRDLLSDLEGRFSEEDDKALIVTHKDVEPVLMSYNPKFEMETGHWGALQGRNMWQDCNKIVLFGMPYLPNVLTMNAYQVFKGPVSPDLATEDEKEHMDQTRAKLKRGWLITDIIQAFNRVQCRKVTDGEGNCEPTEGYVLFKSMDEAQQIIPVIEREMPGIEIVWSSMMETSKKKKTRVSRSDAVDSFCKFLEVMDQGECSKTDVQNHLGLSPRKMDELVKQARDPESKVGQAMLENEVTLKQKRKGKSLIFNKP